MSKTSSFKDTEKKHDVYRGKDYIKKICESLRQHAMKRRNFKKKKIKSLINEQHKSHENEKICYICKEKFEDKYTKLRDYNDHTDEYRGATHSICNL